MVQSISTHTQAHSQGRGPPRCCTRLSGPQCTTQKGTANEFTACVCVLLPCHTPLQDLPVHSIIPCALTSCAPQYVRVSNGDTVGVAVIPPTSLDQAVLVTLEIGYLVKKKASLPQEMDAQELTAVFQKRFAGQVLNGNMEMSMEFIGTNYLIKVLGALKVDPIGDQVRGGECVLLGG